MRNQKEIERLRAEWESLGKKVPGVDKKEHWDQNVITPGFLFQKKCCDPFQTTGTNFMFKLSQFLHFYIADRLNGDPAWQKVRIAASLYMFFQKENSGALILELFVQIKVILSDANVPGEGEHKVRRRANRLYWKDK